MIRGGKWSAPRAPGDRKLGGGLGLKAALDTFCRNSFPCRPCDGEASQRPCAARLAPCLLSPPILATSACGPPPGVPRPQGHVDMVCEANASSKHDFYRDPISLVLDEGWLKADGTTLGADNGVGERGGVVRAGGWALPRARVPGRVRGVRVPHQHAWRMLVGSRQAAPCQQRCEQDSGSHEATGHPPPSCQEGEGRKATSAPMKPHLTPAHPSRRHHPFSAEPGRWRSHPVHPACPCAAPTPPSARDPPQAWPPSWRCWTRPRRCRTPQSRRSSQWRRRSGCWWEEGGVGVGDGGGRDPGAGGGCVRSRGQSGGASEMHSCEWKRGDGAAGGPEVYVCRRGGMQWGPA
jgi:hypothetical protein